MGSAINVALPEIGHEFNSSAVLLSWVATSYLLAAAIFLIPFGRISDIVGRKKIFLTGIVIFTLATLLCTFSGSIKQLIIYRILQALGSAMIFSTGIAIVSSVFEPGERGKAIGITIGAVYLGLTIGPFAGGMLTEYFGWRSLFYALVPLGLISIFLITRYIKEEWAEAKGEKLDVVGSLVYAMGLTALMYGFSQITQIAGAVICILGVLLIIAFVFWEIRQKSPLLDMRLFKQNIPFRYSNLAALINYSATFAVAFLLSLYLQYIKGLSPRDAGIILVTSPVIMTIFTPIAGKISDKTEPRLVASAGMALSTIGLFLLVFIDFNTNISYLVLTLAEMGFGFALFSSPNTNAIMSSVEKKQLGVASGAVSTMRLVGQMLSMGISMLLFSVIIGKSVIKPENYALFLRSVKIAFAIFAFLCFLGIFASLARGNLQRKN